MKKLLLLLIMPALLLSSCKEETNEVEEFANWQKTNETAWRAKFSNAIANATDNLDTIRCFSLTGKADPAAEDFIVVEKLPQETFFIKPGTKTGSPLFTDSVSVSYRGRLQPSPSYASGFVFDQSFTTPEYNAQIARPVKFVPSGLVAGFSTALQHMHIGDHWLVSMPHQLAYGESKSSSIPAYSMLTFEIILEDYWN